LLYAAIKNDEVFMPTTQKVNELFDLLWKDYVQTTPDAKKIYDLFINAGEKVINDHIALRTFNHPKLNLDVCAKVFLDNGYHYVGDYQFPEKKLYAKHFEHADENMPKVFISELKIQEMDEKSQKIINQLIEQVKVQDTQRFDFVCMGRPWEINLADYNYLKEKSEYASWLAAWGFRANHFTVHVNFLKKFATLADLNTFVKKAGFKFNDAGGEIKGTKEVYLEQSSILAGSQKVKFSDGEQVIPACYYEFAKRYPLPNGKLYQGFVAASADKIFESTNRAQ